MSIAPIPVSVELPALPEGWCAIQHKPLRNSCLAIVGTNVDLSRASRWQKIDARLFTFDRCNLVQCFEFALRSSCPIVDQFPDGRWLVTEARSDGSGNARVFSREGVQQTRIELGDGINHVKIDDEQNIWVGWSDEGIFGNRDWVVPGLAQAPSLFGVAAFDSQGNLLRQPRSVSVADCYALNAFGAEMWACTYTDFPVLRMTAQEEQVWPTSLKGTKALAVNGPYVLAAGGYDTDANRLVLLEVNSESAKQLGEYRMPFQAEGIGLIDGRADELHVMHDQTWHRWRVSNFVGS